MEENRTKIKVVLTGNTQVGKTSLANRFVSDSFDDNLRATIYNDIYTKNVDFDDNLYSIEIWDTAGQEKFSTLAPLSYRGANAILMLFTCDDENTLEGLEKWEENISKSVNLNSIILLIVATKSDKLNEDDLNSIMNRAKSKFSNLDESKFFITSSKTGSGINQLFDYIIQSSASSNSIITPERNLEEASGKQSCC